MWFHDTRCKTYLKWGLGAAFGIALCSIAHGQTAELLSVQPATVKDGAVEVYGIVRGLGDHPFEDGAVLAVQVTAAESDASTALRQNAGGKPCADCTTTHYFLVRKPGEEQPKLLTRSAPGPVTYIHIDGKEYMLGECRLVVDRPRRAPARTRHTLADRVRTSPVQTAVEGPVRRTARLPAPRRRCRQNGNVGCNGTGPHRATRL